MSQLMQFLKMKRNTIQYDIRKIASNMCPSRAGFLIGKESQFSQPTDIQFLFILMHQTFSKLLYNIHFSSIAV